MTTTRRTRLTGCLLSLAAIAFAACGGGEPVAAPERETERAAIVTRSALADVSEAARAYGQAHLGHFLKLKVRDLKEEGLELPSTVALKIDTDHTGYCIRARNDSLPSIHPWSIGTVSSRDRVPSPSDRCRS